MTLENTKSVLVLGATGMLGHIVYRILSNTKGITVVGTSRNPKSKAYVYFDAQEPFEYLTKSIDVEGIDFIVNCIGLLVKDSEKSPETAARVNTHLPKWLERMTQGTSTRVIHISTDCVFHGDRGQYATSCAPDATTRYGRSKALGEIYNSKDLTLRTSIVGPDTAVQGTGLLNWFMTRDIEDLIYGFENAYWSGCSTIELANIVKTQILSSTPYVGLAHVSREKKISKFELLKCFRVLRKSFLSIEPVSEPFVDKSLIPTLGFEIPSSYAQMVFGMHKWVAQNPELYPHYINISNEKDGDK